VQGEIQRVLGHLLGSPVELTCAGRTDAGVHARGQVAHVDVLTLDPAIDEGRINRALPDDIRVIRLQQVSTDFDARFSALWRRYSYTVCDRPTGPDPLTRHLVLDHPKPLDIDRMNDAAQALIGVHDFASFCKLREGGTTVREIFEIRWVRNDVGDAVMHVKADAFCHSMVRSTAGALIAVGDGRKPVGFPAEALAKASRDAGVTVMPPHPLVFEEVGYPGSDGLLQRQAVTRAPRT
jgi:tRNA pseudouridine38-40 synthase